MGVALCKSLTLSWSEKILFGGRLQLKTHIKIPKEITLIKRK